MLLRADVVPLRCTLKDTTRHIIGRAELAAMKPASALINSSRVRTLDRCDEALSGWPGLAISRAPRLRTQGTRARFAWIPFGPGRSAPRPCASPPPGGEGMGVGGKPVAAGSHPPRSSPRPPRPPGLAGLGAIRQSLAASDADQGGAWFRSFSRWRGSSARSGDRGAIRPSERR
ncbi:NAD(P)-dependent oxidoreductase [Defluviimonas salinarum]|uniref:NAD(P)-dependent oxidoreductase n=1 Tax=Defluviimonas salinarum TaxID=2992147 RepID=UPI00338EA71B